MSTYVRALSPWKTEAGSDASLLPRRSRTLWGGGRETVRLTLFRHRNAFSCTSVCSRADQCFSGVQVRADLKKQHVARQSSTRVNGHRDVKHKEYAFTVLLERDLDRHDSSYQSGPH